MASSLRRGLVRSGKVFLFLLICAFVLSLTRYFWPAPSYKGSPPRRYAQQRSSVDFSEHGAWWGKWAKTFRPTRHMAWWGWLETMVSPSLIAGPVVEHYVGWDVYADRLCLTGEVVGLHISDDDGDIGFGLRLPPGTERFAWRRNHPEDRLTKLYPDALLGIEVDEDIRDNFPVVYDMRDGDIVKVCGPWVYDRGHDHNEIHIDVLRIGHHHGWLEIIEEKQ